MFICRALYLLAENNNLYDFLVCFFSQLHGRNIYSPPRNRYWRQTLNQNFTERKSSGPGYFLTIHYSPSGTKSPNPLKQLQFCLFLTTWNVFWVYKVVCNLGHMHNPSPNRVQRKKCLFYSKSNKLCVLRDRQKFLCSCEREIIWWITAKQGPDNSLNDSKTYQTLLQTFRKGHR